MPFSFLKYRRSRQIQLTARGESTIGRVLGAAGVDARRRDAGDAGTSSRNANDSAMLQRCALGILVIGPEGSAVEALLKAKVIVPDICSALDLLLYPKRLMATLRR
jgi:hypothetical protein